MALPSLYANLNPDVTLWYDGGHKSSEEKIGTNIESNNSDLSTLFKYLIKLII